MSTGAAEAAGVTDSAPILVLTANEGSRQISSAMDGRESERRMTSNHGWVLDAALCAMLHSKRAS
jgi:hypothetical protein